MNVWKAEQADNDRNKASPLRPVYCFPSEMLHLSYTKNTEPVWKKLGWTIVLSPEKTRWSSGEDPDEWMNPDMCSDFD